MKDATILILLLIGIIFAILFFNEQSKHNQQPEIIRDTTWVVDTLQPNQPKPVVIQGMPDTLAVIDWAAMDSLKRTYGDSITTHLAQQFTLTYDDTIQKTKVRVNPLLKSALFSPFYKPQLFNRPEITETHTIQKRSFFELSLGAGYRHSDAKYYFFLDASFNVNDNLTITPRLSNESIGGEVRYKILRFGE